jgi:hypothetical protein
VTETEPAFQARRAREAAVGSAYEPLGGLKQLGEAGGGEGRVWVGADGSPGLGGLAGRALRGSLRRPRQRAL